MSAKAALTSCAVLCWIITHGIILPYEIYWAYKLWQNREAYVIKKRKPRLLILNFVNIWLLMFIVLLFMTMIIQPGSLINDTVHNNIERSLWFMVAPLMWINLILYVSRYWIIFYMMKYCAAVKHNKWQSIIDPKTATSNWYLENIDKWGSLKYLKYYLIAYGINAYFMFNLLVPILKACGMSEESILSMIIGVLLFIIAMIMGILLPFTLWIYMLCKLPGFDDNIGIRSELKFTIFSAMVIIIAIIILMIIAGILENRDAYDQLGVIFYVWFILLRCFMLINALKHSRWSLIKFKDIVLGRHSSARALKLTHNDTILKLEQQQDLEMAKINEENEVIALRKELRLALQNGPLFDAFMEHLFTEYCGECLLSIVEFTQFKEKIVSQNKDNVEFKSEILDRAIILPCDDKHCPKSFIVYGDEDPNYISNYKSMAHRLYNKYIRVGGVWEINIDYGNRKRYRNLFENIDDDNIDLLNNINITELYQLFDPCIDHMFALIMPAFTRFKNGDQYQLIQTYSPPMRTPKLSIMKLIPRISMTLSNPTEIEMKDTEEKYMEKLDENNQI